MSEKEINEMIAVFMGKESVDNICECCQLNVTQVPICQGDKDGVKISHALGGRVIELHYHNSWSWLMPVLRKFNDLNIHDEFIRKHWLTVKGHYGTRNGKRYVAYCDMVDDVVTREYNINDAYKAISKAIQWYLSLKK